MAAVITVVCPQCNNRMEASSEHIGRKGRCNSCKALVNIEPQGGSQSLASLHQSPDRTARRATFVRHGSTSVSIAMAGLLGLVATVVIFLSLWPFRDTYIGKLFLGDSVIPYLTTLLTTWGLAILALKYVAVKRELSILDKELELIPLEIGMQITPTNVDQFIVHLSSLPADQRLSILGRRVFGAIDHFRSRKSVPEVQDYLAAHAEIEASQVDTGYTVLRVFIWAIPILGFIGTVMGISEAVSGLDSSLTGGNQAAQLMTAMRDVTGGLSTAFNTTLLALSMAIVLLFPTETLRKTEYEMLDRVGSFANESLLRRMAEDGDDELPEIVQDALESAFREHQRWLAQWQTQVSKLGESIGGAFEQSVDRIQNKMADSEEDRMRRLRELLSSTFQEAGEASAALRTSEHAIIEKMNGFIAAAQKLQQLLTDNIKQFRVQHDRQMSIAAPKESDLSSDLRNLQREIENLRNKVEDQNSAENGGASGLDAPDQTLSMHKLPDPDDFKG